MTKEEFIVKATELLESYDDSLKEVSTDVDGPYQFIAFGFKNIIILK